MSIKRQLFILLSAFLFTTSLCAQPWIKKGQNIDGDHEHDSFGITVRIDATGNTIVMCAPMFDFPVESAGVTRAYSWDGTSWIQKGQDLYGEGYQDAMVGVDINAAGNIIALGMYGHDGGGTLAGTVRIYKWNGSIWDQLGSDIYGENGGDRSGCAISLSSDGHTIAIAAYENDGGGFHSGHVRVFSWNGSSWIQKGSDMDGEALGDRSGEAAWLSGDGNTVIVGALNNDGSALQGGHARVYSWNGSDWSQKGSDLDGTHEWGAAGRAVTVNHDGSVIAVTYTNSVVGYVKVFRWNGSSWVLKGTEILEEDSFIGKSLSLSADGNVLAAGGGSSSDPYSWGGNVKVFKWESGQWNQIGENIHGESIDARSGSSVDISADGNSVIIGAFSGENAFGIETGNARVYYIEDTTINDPPAAISASIFPNPMIHNGNIELSRFVSDQANLVAVSSIGRVVLKKKIQGNFVNIDGVELPAGYYRILLEEEGSLTSLGSLLVL
ncbi:MAG: hypothetical protein HOK65_02375 [Crocinitomicaceae bacterium]|nr:hypothetical protein [Crocinitomicaceae bacterium]